MKRLLAMLLSLAMLLPTMAVSAANETTQAEDNKAIHEVWIRKPELSHYSKDDLIILKSIDKNQLYMYAVPELGDGYYFVIADGQMTDGGYNGKSATSQYYYYLLLETEDSFIILDYKYAYNENITSGGVAVECISDRMDAEYYTGVGSATPLYLVCPKRRYIYGRSGYTDYVEYVIVGSDGKLCVTQEKENGELNGYHTVGDGKLLYAHDKYYQYNGNKYYTTDTGETAYNFKTVRLINGSVSYGAASNVATTEATAANGYTMYKEGFTGNCSKLSFYKVTGEEDLYVSAESVPVIVSGSTRYNDRIRSYRKIDGKMKLIEELYYEAKTTMSNVGNAVNLGKLNEEEYTDNGYLVPRMCINNLYYIMDNGKIIRAKFSSPNFPPSSYSSYVRYNSKYNGKLVVARTMNNSASYYYERDPNNSDDTKYYYWQVLNYIYFDRNGNTILGDDMKVKVGIQNGMEGGFTSTSAYTAPSSVTSATLSNAKEWWNKGATNVFPDGRSVYGEWWSTGSESSFEVAFLIYDKNNKMISVDGTGRTTGSYNYNNYNIIGYTISNDKFVLCLDHQNNSMAIEMFRVAVSTENDKDEAVTIGGIGEKIITPPEESDTEIVLPNINFGDESLPIGYNIKDNVITKDHLDIDLKDNATSVRLNDITIVAQEGYASGVQNAGCSLSEFDLNDTGFGQGCIRVYTNGQNFNWYVSDKSKLEPGVYPRTYTIDDKTVYVTFKVISPPEADSWVTVVF